MNAVPLAGSVRIAPYMQLTAILGEFGIELREVLAAAGAQEDIFDNPDNLVPYPLIGKLLSVSAQLTNCDHIGLLLGQSGRLAIMGLAGQIALCADTAGEGLQKFADFFSLHNTAAIIGVIKSDDFTQMVYAIAEPGMGDTSHIQLGAMAVGFNVLQDLCGAEWLPTLVTIACSAPSNLRPCQKFFRAPIRFDSDESALIFESHWLERPLPPLDRAERRQIEAQVRARHAAVMADFPTTIRQVIRKQLGIGEVSMEKVAARLAMHRRTLDRRLKQHGLVYSEVLESVRRDAACQLLRDTHLHMQEIAESLHYSSAANFSTAFRRWTGVTPSQFRHSAR